MSILETPRIIFGGQISWDPVTTNNYTANYDEGKCETIFMGGENVAGFRASAIKQVGTAGNWNPHGTYRSTFFETLVKGVDTGSGVGTKDPFVCAPVSFTGMLVDTEPYGSYSSQLFFDEISFGIDGGCRIYAPRSERFTDRYINFSRNPSNNKIAGVASVIWQTCFPKEAGLVVNAYNSKALQALEKHLQKKDVLGLTVRWDSYRTVYYDDPALSNGSPGSTKKQNELIAKLKGGGFQPNPARSLLVGTVGLWRQGEPFHEPGDRALLTKGLRLRDGASIGTAFARLSEKSITLDLSNCIPEKNRKGEKHDLGNLTILAVDPENADKKLELASFGYDLYNQDAYENTSGIIELPVDQETANQAAKMNLKLVGAGRTILSETPLRAIPMQPNLYIDEGKQIQTPVQVYDRGNPADAGIQVTISEDGASQPFSERQETDANGQVRFRLLGSQGSVTGLVIQPGTPPALPVSINPQTTTYMYLRVLPADEDIAKKDPTWQNVHDYVLSNWEAMAPCMDNWLLLGDEAQVKAYAKIIKKLTDPQNFESFRYMPVTRDLTAGQRTLLYNFLDGTAATSFEGKTEAVTSDEETEPDYDKLSKAMRGN